MFIEPVRFSTCVYGATVYNIQLYQIKTEMLEPIWLLWAEYISLLKPKYLLLSNFSPHDAQLMIIVIQSWELNDYYTVTGAVTDV